MPFPSHLEVALANLAALEREAALAGDLPGLTADRVYERPPGDLSVFPCLLNVANTGQWEEPGFGEGVLLGQQRETAVLELYTYTRARSPDEAQVETLPILEGLRVLLNGHKDLGGACRLARVVRWRRGILEYALKEFHGMVLEVEARFDLPGGFGAAPLPPVVVAAAPAAPPAAALAAERVVA